MLGVERKANVPSIVPISAPYRTAEPSRKNEGSAKEEASVRMIGLAVGRGELEQQSARTSVPEHEEIDRDNVAELDGVGFPTPPLQLVGTATFQEIALHLPVAARSFDEHIGVGVLPFDFNDLALDR